LRDVDGNLIFLGSYYAKYPYPPNPLYAATKFWTRGFALSLQGQVGDDGVAVTVINPSEVRTEWGADYRNEASKDRYEPGTVPEPEHIADAIHSAASQPAPNTMAEVDIFRCTKFGE
jgi:NADP-dependent 3-hydroxy acid dehydrogenase YdfG